MKKYKIKYTFYFKSWNNSYLQKSIQYWEAHRFSCRTESENRIAGFRGSIWGNFFSFNMQKLLCKLDLHCESDGQVISVLTLNGFSQDITDANLDDFKLELILFQRSLLNLPSPDDFLNEYRKARRSCAIAWSFSFRILLGRGLQTKGRRLPEEIKYKIKELCDSGQIPSVERIA